MEGALESLLSETEDAFGFRPDQRFRRENRILLDVDPPDRLAGHAGLCFPDVDFVNVKTSARLTCHE